MAFAKVTYIDNETVITAKNLNEIQDEVIRIGDMLDSGELQEEMQAMIDTSLEDFEGGGGEPGKDGEDGYTPVKGVDYWTEEDKAEIKSYVDEAILGGAW